MATWMRLPPRFGALRRATPALALLSAATSAAVLSNCRPGSIHRPDATEMRPRRELGSRSIATDPPIRAVGVASRTRPRVAFFRGDPGTLCVAFDNGHARCWGNNGRGALGFAIDQGHAAAYGPRDGSTPPMCLAPGEHAVDFGLGGSDVCVLLSTGSLRCFGPDRLGPGDTTDGICGSDGGAVAPVDLGSGRHVIGVAAGAYHFCALLGGGCVKCWGANDHGQLGLGDLRARGDASWTMGDSLSCVDLGRGRTARAVSAGRAFSCALLDDGHVKCWGKGEQLGIGSKADRGGGPGQLGDALPEVDLGTGKKAVALESGPQTTCAILDSGEVKCWGRGTGAIGSCEVLVTGDEPGEMGDVLAPVALGTKRKPIAVSVGLEQACALFEGGSLKCWGANYNGQLRVGDSRPHGCGGMGRALPYVDLGAGRAARQVAVGMAGICVLLDDGTLACWGPEWWQGRSAAIDVGE